MPIASLSKRQATIDSVGGARPGVPEGKKSSHFFQQVGQGEPRHADLFAIRLLGQSPYMEWAKDIIKQQVTSTPLRIVPDVPEDEQPSEEHIEAAESATRFFEGNFNDDNESLDHFLNVVLNDVLDFNSGVVELVPDEQGFLDQIVTRDGLTFTKNLKESGLLAEDPAYLQFELSRGFTRHVGTTTGGVQGIDLREAVRDAHVFPFRVFSRETIEYNRDQIVWFQMDGRSSNPYGRGRVQKVRQLAEILLNGDIHRERYFLDDQYQKAVVQLAEANQNEIDSLKAQLRNDKGNPHDLNVVGGRALDVHQIDPEPEKMQFLESHKWYTKLALVVMGLNEAEGGIHENANLSVSEEMKRNAWRRTTKPMLEMLERTITRQILPFMREFHAVDGDLRARFEPQNRFEKTQQQAIEDKELELQAMTPNEVREERGKEGYGPIGDLPMQAYQQIIQQVPSWSVEQISDELDDVPDPSAPGGDPLLSLFDNDDDDNDAGAEDDGREGRDFECPFPFDSVEDCVQEMKDEDAVDNPHALCNAWQNACDKVNQYADDYQTALEDGNREQVLEGTREALRNDRSGEFPPLKSHAEDLGKQVADLFADGVDAVVQDAAKEFPDEDADTSLVVDADRLAERFDVSERLEAELRASNLEAMEEAADHHATKLENDLEERLTLPGGTRIDIDFDLMDTFTAERIKEKAARAATTVNDTVKRQIREVILDGAENGWSSQRIADELRDRVGGEFRDEHAEVVARTETLSASRDGSQALAESTDLVDGKEWIATDDNRTRPWHAAMDGVIEPVNDRFTVPSGWTGAPDYQPSDYPRTARTVGEDQPFNCFDGETEVMTENGWKRFENLEDGERVFTFDMETGELVAQHPTEYIEKEAEEIVRIENMTLDVAATPEHDMVIRQDGKMEKRMLKELMENRANSSVSLPAGNNGVSRDGDETVVLQRVTGEYKYQDDLYEEEWSRKEIPAMDWARFLGIYLTEGWTGTDGGYNVSIAASKQEVRENVEDLLRRMGYKPHRHENAVVVQNKQLALETAELSKGAAQKTIPEYVFNWSKETINEFLNWYELGDGNRTDWGRRIWTTSEEMADQIQQLFLMTGNDASVTVGERDTVEVMGEDCEAEDLYCVQERSKQNKSFDLRSGDAERVEHNDTVYCVTVSNGTLVVRRNKKAIIAGNCRCAQAPVPAEDMPDTVRSALDHDTLTVETELTEKQLEVFAEHSRDNDQSFAEFWRTVTENWTNQEIVNEKEIVGSKSTIYDWTETFLE